MKKLQLFCGPTWGRPTEAWKILGEYAGLYGDNGGDPDGDAWLPSDQDDIPDEVAERVVQAGLGQMVDVFIATDEGIVNYLGQHYDAGAVLGLRVRLARDEWDREDDTRRIKDAADACGLQWAHYGAYGAMDSHWIFVKPEKE